ncbi:SLBB domain-containing protein [Verrucomicrobium spinosum]|uniref:SLBB domain-containing protein n=1 Tax=Verrucomicrobium spinosum TaxID=2736 RepID=UPI0009465BDA|nr:polysaccharide biosynthesis/export family protein [Verrucomicrobium spinosum]
MEKELGKAASSSAKLRDAQDELARLLLRYTNEHPAVIEARERLLVAESEFKMAPENSNVLPKPGENPLAESLYLDIVKLRAEKEVIGKQLEKLQGVRAELAAKLEQLPRKALEYARILSEKKVLETSRSLLEARQREAALQEERATNPFRLLSMPRPAEVTVEKPVKKLAMAGAAGFAGGMGAVAMTSILLTGLGTTISSRFMLKRVTGLGYVAASPRTRGAGDPETSAWAFHTWTQIHPLLRPSPSGMLVCGILDADTKQASGELPMILASAAALRGHRVVWMPQQQGADTGAASLDQVMGGAGLEIAELSPEAVTLIPQGEKWTWDSDGRRRWGQFVEQSRPVPPAVVLVQLTDLGAPRTLLAAETMPNLLLLVPSGEIRGGEMQRLIEPFLSSRCRLIGAVLDRPKPFRIPLLNRLALGIFSAGLWMAVGGAAVAQEPPLTLGAGDSVNIAVMGRPELSRSAVSLAPDGTLTYLQVQGMKAAGLTLDELRSALNKSVAKYYKNAVVVVTPGSFQSRKVYVLGKVVKKGAINLDRPMSLVEIVAEAGGLETGLFQQNTVELADLGRSFLMRGNARVGVDMEALFLKGDMSQNVRVQAGDYLYFPSANSNEIYVLGNVKMQGTQGLLSYTTVVSAVTQAGGFTPKAYTKRVLVVRGSLHKPELHVANLEAMLEGREKGFRLEPKDILYVADKPWAAQRNSRVLPSMPFCKVRWPLGRVRMWVPSSNDSTPCDCSGLVKHVLLLMFSPCRVLFRSWSRRVMTLLERIPNIPAP